MKVEAGSQRPTQAASLQLEQALADNKQREPDQLGSSDGAGKAMPDYPGLFSPEPVSPSRQDNPFAPFARGGRLPFITQDRIGREVKVAREDFNERAMHKLKAWQEKVGKRMDPSLYPSFMRHGRKFSILVDGFRIHMTDILGHGAYGFVFKAEIELGNPYSGSGAPAAKLDVAVKFIFRTHRRNPASSTEFSKARRLPQSLFSSGRIVEYLALCECARYANSEAELVIMELAEMGDLYDSLIQDGAPRLYSANHARRLIAMAIEAMADLRQAGFLHRDLKAENLLFNQHGQMLLGDIGNVKDLEGKQPEQVQTVLGTFATMAPEVSENLSKGCGQALYDCEKSDVWSLGCIYFQLRSCLSVLNDKLLKTSLRHLSEAEGGGPDPGRRANHKFWHKYECWQRNIHGPDGVYFRRPDLAWTRDYQAEPFTKGERDFLDCLLCADHHKRPTLDELLRAVKGQRGTREALRWLGEIGNAAVDDTTKAFDDAMQQRIAGFGQRKNTYCWTVDGRQCGRPSCAAAGEADNQSAMGMTSEATQADLSAEDGRSDHAREKTSLDPGVDPGSAFTPNDYMEVLAMQLRDTIAQVVAKLKYKTDIMNPKRITRTANCIHLHCTIKGPAPLRRRLLQLEAEIAKPTPELTGVITFIRKRGDPAMYLQLIKRFEKHSQQCPQPDRTVSTTAIQK